MSRSRAAGRRAAAPGLFALFAILTLLTLLTLLALIATACASGQHAASHTTTTPTSHAPRTAESLSPAPPGPLRLRLTAWGRLPVPLQREVALWDGGRLYAIGGLNASGASTSAVITIGRDRTAVSLASTATLPRAFHDAAGVALAGRILVFGGGTSGGTDTVQEFVPGTHRASVVGHLPVALSDLSAVRVGGVAYIVGGYAGDGSGLHRDIYATSDGVHFHVAGRLPVQLRYAAVASLGERVIVAGGEDPSGPRREVYSFSPLTGAVAKVGELPVALAHAVAFTMAGGVYVAGGADASGHALRSVYRVDPGTRAVHAAGELHEAVADAAVAVGAGGAWIVGGWNDHGTRATILRATGRRGPTSSTGG